MNISILWQKQVAPWSLRGFVHIIILPFLIVYSLSRLFNVVFWFVFARFHFERPAWNIALDKKKHLIVQSCGAGPCVWVNDWTLMLWKRFGFLWILLTNPTLKSKSTVYISEVLQTTVTTVHGVFSKCTEFLNLSSSSTPLLNTTTPTVTSSPASLGGVIVTWFNLNSWERWCGCVLPGQGTGTWQQQENQRGQWAEVQEKHFSHQHDLCMKRSEVWGTLQTSH